MKSIIFSFVLVSASVSTIFATTPESETPRQLTQAEMLVIASNQVFVDIMNNHLQRAYQDLDAKQALTRKIGKNTAAILLYGLAESCAHIGNIFCSSNTESKKQGMLNVAGTVLNVAAQLAEHRPKPASQPQAQQEAATPELEPATEVATIQDLDKDELTTRLADLSSYLIIETENPELNQVIQLPENLAIVRSIPTQEKRQEYIASMLASSAMAKQYLTELFTTLHLYAREKGSLFADLVRENVSYYLSTQAVAAQAAETQNTEPQDTDVPVVKTITQEELQAVSEKIPQNVVDYLTVQFINILQHQIRLATDIQGDATTHEMIDALQASVATVYDA